MPLGPAPGLGGGGVIVEVLVIALWVVVGFVPVVALLLTLDAMKQRHERLRKEFDALRRRIEG